MSLGKIQIMESYPVPKAILLLAFPSMLAMLVQIIYGLTDTFFIARTGNADMVAAITFAMPIMMVFQAAGNIFAVGGASYLSRKLGEQDFDEVKRASATCFYLSFFVGMLLTGFFWLYIDKIVRWFGATSGTFQYTKEYLIVMSSMSFLPILQVTLAGLIRSEGATNHAMIGILLGTGMNIVMDYLFIFEMGMGIKGAAIATLIGNSIGVAYYLIYFIYHSSFLSLNYRFFKPDKDMIYNILAIGIPSSLSALIMGFSNVLTNNIGSAYGENVIAANGINMRLVSVVFFLVMGLAQGYQPFAGYNYGAKNVKRLLASFKVTLIYGSILSVTCAVLLYLFSYQAMALFIDNTQVIRIGQQMIHAFLWAIPLLGVQFTITMTFQATGRAMLAMFLVLGRQLFFFVPLLLILNHYFTFNGYIYAQPVADLATTLVSVLLSVYFVRDLHKIDPVYASKVPK